MLMGENRNEHHAADATDAPVKKRKRRPLWWRIVKWIIIAVVVLALLIVLTIGTAVMILTPEKLTPLVEKYASEYLDADVKVARVELKYWSTFPRLELTVDSLDIVSRSLGGVPAAEKGRLPQWSDSLASVERFHAGVNILELLRYSVVLDNVELSNPRLNAVIVNDSVANFNIVPPSAEEDTVPSALGVPKISLDRFSLNGSFPIRYFNLADSTEAELTLRPSVIEGHEAPVYKLTFGGEGGVVMPGMPRLRSITFGLDGRIDWDYDNPSEVGLRDFIVELGPVGAQFSTVMAMADDALTVKTLDFNLKPVDVARLIAWLPAEWAGPAKAVKTNMTVAGSVKLLKPYKLGSDRMPSLTASLSVPSCRLVYRNMLLNDIVAELKADIDGADMNRSVINVERLKVIGRGVGFETSLVARKLLSDPTVTGWFKGGIRFENLAPEVWKLLPCTMRGDMVADTEFDLRKSMLDRANFHRLNINGDVNLTDFTMRMNDESMDAYVRHARLRFSAGHAVEGDQGRIDSLLAVGMRIDTMAMNMMPLQITGKDLSAGIGVENRRATLAPGAIVPLGGRVSASRVKVNNYSDSSVIVLRDILGRASLRRFENEARRPQLLMAFDAGRIFYRDTVNRLSLADSHVGLQLHPNKRPRMNAATGAIFDSIRVARPELRADSVYALAREEARAQRRARRAASGDTVRRRRDDGRDRIDMRADKETQSLLKWFDASGSIKAARGRLMTPLFPLRNRLRNVDVRFNMDSIIVRDTRLESGRSDFTFNGHITNFVDALTKRRGVINAELSVRSDTVDVNELTQAAYLGAAYSEALTRGTAVRIADSESDEAMQRAVEATASDSVMGALLIPVNVDATLKVRSRNIIYSDIVLHRFRGEVLLHDGALNLRRLSASSDVGSVDLTALYTAPTKQDMSLAMGLDVHNFRIDKFTKMFPAVDSLLPALSSFSGVINAELAVTTAVEPNMDVNLASLNAVLKISGDSLVVMDPETFKTVSKWLLFKDKTHNMIDHMSVQVDVADNQLQIYPFIFNIDRYKLGVMGHNDLAMNLNYHVSVLKSPIPFKFGINIKGTPDKLKIRLGGAKVKEGMAVERVALVDTTRINLVREMERVFQRGVRNARVGKVRTGIGGPKDMPEGSVENDTISHADSLIFIREGLLPAPPQPVTEQDNEKKSGSKKSKKK